MWNNEKRFLLIALNKKRKLLQNLKRFYWHGAIEFPSDWALALIESSQQGEGFIFEMLFTPSPNKLIKIPYFLRIAARWRSEGDEEQEKCHAYQLEPDFFAFEPSSMVLSLWLRIHKKA